MGPDAILSLVQEDRLLAVGDTVVAYWTTEGLTCHARARIVSLKPQLVRVTLLESSPSAPRLKPGNALEIPRITDPVGWSSEHCVRRDRVLRGK